MLPLYRCFLILPLAAASFAQVLTVQTKPADSAAPHADAASAQIDAAAREKVVADLNAKRFDDALAGAKAILTSNPASPQANKLVGVVLLDDQKPADALTYFKKALELDPNDDSVHALLLQVYAQTGDTKDRDAQRAILREYHGNPKHPSFQHSAGFLIETIPYKDGAVQAVEFYEPAGKFHFYYRFNVYDAAGHLQSFYALESDDADQPAYAKEHPKEAAAGGHRFSIDVYSRNESGNPTQGLITFIDGQPSYDDLRGRIMKILNGGVKPAATTVVTPAAKKPDDN